MVQSVETGFGALWLGSEIPHFESDTHIVEWSRDRGDQRGGGAGFIVLVNYPR